MQTHLVEYKKANNKEKIEQTAVLLEQAKKKALILKKFPLRLKMKISYVLNQWLDSIKENHSTNR